MIVRFKFLGIVTDASGKKFKMKDHVDIHSVSRIKAKGIFNVWLRKGCGIRGDSGVYHPLGNEGKIELLDIVELKRGD